MRDYGKVAPSFWTGSTGRVLRRDREAQTVALYLLTGPHSTMIGIFQCPIAYIANDTGLPFEGASEGLRRLVEMGFCSFDEQADLVWVHEMARFQIGDALKPKDNRIAGMIREFKALPKSPLLAHFLERYAHSYRLPLDLLGEPLRRGFGGASHLPNKALQSHEHEHEHHHEQEESLQDSEVFSSEGNACESEDDPDVVPFRGRA